MGLEFLRDLEVIRERPLTAVERSALRGRISIFQETIQADPNHMKRDQYETKHHFSKDVYARELTIPKGHVIVGAIHKFRNLNIISKGKVSFFSVDGALHVEAPYTFIASPGVKRVIYAHEETVWTTIHGTSETDLDKIEEIFIAKSYAEIEGITPEELELIEKEITKLKEAQNVMVSSGSDSSDGSTISVASGKGKSEREST